MPTFGELPATSSATWTLVCVSGTASTVANPSASRTRERGPGGGGSGFGSASGPVPERRGHSRELRTALPGGPVALHAPPAPRPRRRSAGRVVHRRDVVGEGEHPDGSGGEAVDALEQGVVLLRRQPGGRGGLGQPARERSMSAEPASTAWSRSRPSSGSGR